MGVDAISVVDSLLWARERRGGHVAVDLATAAPLWRVATGAEQVGAVVGAGGGQVLAVRRPGMLLLVDDAGRISARGRVDQQINGVRGLTPGVLLVLGKGTLAAVAAP
ncbi:hypothetical protein ACFOW4_00075 [Micromonospora sp. GCM10011542]|uniref:hypothetical protein n=1 Tax=Micromonospora sp. GCM10011542 TaxID=3317337 RepID=UPI00362252D5